MIGQLPCAIFQHPSQGWFFGELLLIGRIGDVVALGGGMALTGALIAAAGLVALLYLHEQQR